MIKKRSSDSKFSNVLLLKQKRERVHDITSPTPWNTQAALSLSLFLLPCYPLNQSTLSNNSNTTLQPIRLLRTWTWLSFNILIWTNLQTRSEQNLFHGRYATCLYFSFATATPYWQRMTLLGLPKGWSHYCRRSSHDWTRRKQNARRSQYYHGRGMLGDSGRASLKHKISHMYNDI